MGGFLSLELDIDTCFVYFANVSKVAGGGKGAHIAAWVSGRYLAVSFLSGSTFIIFV